MQAVTEPSIHRRTTRYIQYINIYLYIHKSQDLFEHDKDERGQTGGIREVHGGRGGLNVAKAEMIGNVGVLCGQQSTAGTHLVSGGRSLYRCPTSAGIIPGDH
jgi:hypothetical protein